MCVCVECDCVCAFVFLMPPQMSEGVQPSSTTKAHCCRAPRGKLIAEVATEWNPLPKIASSTVLGLTWDDLTSQTRSDMTTSDIIT